MTYNTIARTLTSHAIHHPATFLAALGIFALVGVSTAYADPPAAPPQPPAQLDQAQPPGPPPENLPPAPAFAAPPPPSAQPIELHQQQPPTSAAPPQAPTPPPAGQWVYTQQYGWLWMPYDQRYTYVVDSSALAYEYAYYPAYGWGWVVAPWILGFGSVPHWGTFGPGRFAWYAHPWFRVGTTHLRPSWGLGARPGGFGHGHMGGHGRR